MKHMNVSMKLIVSFLIVVVLAVAVGAIGVIGMYSINSADDALYNENVVALSAMGNIREILLDQIVHARNMALNVGDAAKIQEIQNGLATLEQEINGYFAEYEGTITDMAMESAYFEGKAVYLNEFADIKKRVAEASRISAEEAYEATFNPRTIEIRNTMVNDFDKAMKANDEWARQRTEDNSALFMKMLIIEIACLVAAVVIALFLAFYISGMISKPLALLSAFMKKASSTGDLALSQADVEIIGKMAESKDEIGQTINASAAFVGHITEISKKLEVIAGGDLTVKADVLSDEDTIGVSLKSMLGNLNNMFGEINSATEQVSAGSKQIADGAQALAQGATEQASSIEELAASLSEVSRKTNENADMAKEASRLSGDIKVSAEKGSSQMGNMMKAVTEINEASTSISRVIKVIDDIAFQTNILALNAAVEAARAGQHGKGFAVVAEEVRNLAAKSAEAAKDTSELIENSIEKANLGLSIATETSESLKSIVEGINNSADIIVKIEGSSNQQAAEIAQINNGIDQITFVVQQNSATAEESAAASEEMSGQSTMLQQLITQFKLADSGFSGNVYKPAAAPAAFDKAIDKPEMPYAPPATYAPKTPKTPPAPLKEKAAYQQKAAGYKAPGQIAPAQKDPEPKAPEYKAPAHRASANVPNDVLNEDFSGPNDKY